MSPSPFRAPAAAASVRVRLATLPTELHHVRRLQHDAGDPPEPGDRRCPEARTLTDLHEHRAWHLLATIEGRPIAAAQLHLGAARPLPPDLAARLELGPFAAALGAPRIALLRRISTPGSGLSALGALTASAADVAAQAGAVLLLAEGPSTLAYALAPLGFARYQERLRGGRPWLSLARILPPPGLDPALDALASALAPRRSADGAGVGVAQM